MFGLIKVVKVIRKYGLKSWMGEPFENCCKKYACMSNHKTTVSLWPMETKGIVCNRSRRICSKFWPVRGVGHLVVQAEDTIKCTNSDCGLIYPIRDGIPVMLIEEAVSWERSDYR